MHSTTLQQFVALQEILESIQRAVSTYPSNQYSGTSEMWEALFARRNTDRAFDSFFRMLDHKNDLTLGIANLSEERFFDDYARLYTQMLDEEDLRRIVPGATGCPSLLMVHGLPASIAVMQNETRIKQIFAHIDQPTRPIRVLEIGAGYGGMANLLIKRELVSSYTVVDLPDNLAQSAYFLTAENPEYTAHYCEARDITSDKHINFFTPNEIQKLDDSTYDLIINCDSLGEMPADVARSYIALIAGKLSEKGVFYSKNGVSRNTNTVESLSEYGFQRFDLQTVTSTPLSTGLYDDHSTVLFLRRGPSQKDVNWSHMDTLSMLYKFGLTTELEEVARQLVDPPVSDEIGTFLDCMRSLLDSRGKQFEPAASIQDAHLQAAITYMRGMYDFVFHSESNACEKLSSYVEVARSPMAEGQARVFLSKHHKEALFPDPADDERTRFFLRHIRLPIAEDENAHKKFLKAVELRVKNRFLGLLQ